MPRFAYLLLMLITLLGIIGPAPALAVNESEITVASDSALATIRSALRNEDSHKLASIFTSSGAVIPPAGPAVTGRFSIRATAAIMLTAFGGGELTATRGTVSIIDGVPYETGRYTFERKLDDDKVQKITGRYTLIWQLEDGVWKIHRALGIK